MLNKDGWSPDFNDPEYWNKANMPKTQRLIAMRVLPALTAIIFAAVIAWNIVEARRR